LLRASRISPGGAVAFAAFAALCTLAPPALALDPGKALSQYLRRSFAARDGLPMDYDQLQHVRQTRWLCRL
jgi:hypothetical protein